MTIIRQAIIEEVNTRLAAISGIAQSDIMPSGEADVYPHLILDDQGQSPLPGESDAIITRYVIRLAIVGVVIGDEAATNPGLDAWQRANTLYRTVVATLMSDQQTPLGGRAEIITEGDLGFDVAMLAIDRTLAFTLSFQIQFINRSTDPALS